MPCAIEISATCALKLPKPADCRDAAEASRRERRSPSRFFRGEVRARAAAAATSRTAGGGARRGSLPAGGRHLVEEALREERVLREADRSPVAGRDRQIRDRGTRPGCSGCRSRRSLRRSRGRRRCAVPSTSDRRCARTTRSASRRRRAGRHEPHAGRRTIQVVLQLVVARVGQLDRRADGLGDLRRPRRRTRRRRGCRSCRPCTSCAPHVGRRQPRRLHGGAVRLTGDLRAGPDLADAVLDLRRRTRTARAARAPGMALRTCASIGCADERRAPASTSP